MEKLSQDKKNELCQDLKIRFKYYLNLYCTPLSEKVEQYKTGHYKGKK